MDTPAGQGTLRDGLDAGIDDGVDALLALLLQDPCDAQRLGAALGPVRRIGERWLPLQGADEVWPARQERGIATALG